MSGEDAGRRSGESGTDEAAADPLRSRRTRLSAAQRALLAKRLRGRKAAAAGRAGGEGKIPRRDDRHRAPLSFAQLRLWRFAEAHPRSTLHNVYHAVELTGPLAVAPLARALDEIVRRHEVLRLRFEVVAGEPAGAIAPARSLPLPVADLSALPGPRHRGEIHQLIQRGAAEPFDLAAGPLLRAWLLCLDREKHVLVLAVHHIIIDGWSLGLLVRELGILYQAFDRGRPSPLPEPPIQYGDFALWQRRRVAGPGLAKQRAYWRDRLTGCPPELELANRPRPAERTYRGASRAMVLTEELSRALASFARRQGVTLFIVLLAAFKVLLYRFSGQRDVVVGTPVAGRFDKLLEGLVGNFLNLLALRTDLRGNPRFRELLQRVRNNTLEAFGHQELPFEQLVAELGLEEEPDRTPLFQVVFNHLTKESGKHQARRQGDLDVQPYLTGEIGSEFDLIFYAVEQGETLRISFGYDAELFDPARMAEISDSYRSLLEEIVADPEKRLAELAPPARRRLSGG